MGSEITWLVIDSSLYSVCVASRCQNGLHPAWWLCCWSCQASVLQQLQRAAGKRSPRRQGAQTGWTQTPVELFNTDVHTCTGVSLNRVFPPLFSKQNFIHTNTAAKNSVHQYEKTKTQLKRCQELPNQQVAI